MIEAVIGEVRMDKGLLITDEKVKPKAPGMKYRHYAPKADLAVVEGNTVIRTGKKRPAAICSVLAIQKNDTLTGIGSLGIEFRGNTIISSRPNVSSFIPGEGYWNEVRSTTMDALNHVKGIVGTVFDGNTSINMDYAYRLSLIHI